MTDCTQNIDPLKLVREGTSQDQRMLSTPDSPAALDPAYAPVDGRKIAHDIVFAQSYAALLKYFGTDNSEVAVGDWQSFFSKDVCALLAMITNEDVDAYRINIKKNVDYLNERENHLNTALLKKQLRDLYSSIATLARQLDLLKDNLPTDTPLKEILKNLINMQLAPAFKRLISYYKAAGTLVNSASPLPDMLIFRSQMVSFASVLSTGLSQDWSDGLAWAAYESGIDPDHTVYGNPGSVYVRINHLVTHNFFKSIFDQFLKVYARIVSEASVDLERKLTNWDKHEPHYALFLAFLNLFKNVRQETNTLTGRHLDFYYREVLRLKERPAEPSHAHLLVELAKHATTREFKTGELFKAGKDDSGRDAYFANDQTFVANKAKVVALKSVYRHGKEEVGTDTSISHIHANRLFASPIANSDNGVDAKLTTEDQSWHPFFNKVYANGKLTEILMSQAEIGFAIASHYLLMAEGTRTITLEFTITGDISKFTEVQKDDLVCQLSGEKGWIDASVSEFATDSTKAVLHLAIKLTGAEPAVTPYSAKTHGYVFATELPVLLVKLRHSDDKYIYSFLQNAVITKIDLAVCVTELKTLAVSNDFGPVDTSKPFQPFGPSPVKGNCLIIGSKEIFQKDLKSAKVKINWSTKPISYYSSPRVLVDYLSQGNWHGVTSPEISIRTNAESAEFPFPSILDMTLDKPDFSDNEYFNTAIRQGFVKLALTDGFGHAQYQADLIQYLATKVKREKPTSLIELIMKLSGKKEKVSFERFAEFLRNLVTPSKQNELHELIRKLDSGKGKVDPEELANLIMYLVTEGEKQNSENLANLINDLVTKDAKDNPGELAKLINVLATKGAKDNPENLVRLIMYLVTEDKNANSGDQPVAPSIGKLTLDYVASTELKISPYSPDSPPNRQGGFFHLAPFGQAVQQSVPKTEGNVYLLPQFDFQLNSETKESEAEFYIGITGLQPPQNLALLFQVADGTADPLVEKPKPPHIHWSYLKDNEWCEFGPYDVQDITGELLNSGTVTFAMPSDASDKNTIFPSGMFWIRAAVKEKSEAICRLKMVAAQAIKTTFINKENSSTFSAQPLIADTISKLNQPDSAVKTITQPFSSFGGRGAELPAEFYTRISERLRHKDRAIAFWDYERLVLEAFPQIYKAKCLNHTYYEPSGTGAGAYRELAAGHVTVVTVPNLQFHNLRDPLKPYTSLGLLDQIKAFLQKRLGCFATLHVKNPQFEEVRVEFGLRLREGYDENYYSRQIKLAITRFLSPWAFSEGGSPSFGGKIYKSVLIKYIEDQPCVDYVTDFKLYLDIAGNRGGRNMDEVEGSAAISILVSAPSSEHVIHIIKADDVPTKGSVCSCSS